MGDSPGSCKESDVTEQLNINSKVKSPGQCFLFSSLSNQCHKPEKLWWSLSPLPEETKAQLVCGAGARSGGGVVLQPTSGSTPKACTINHGSILPLLHHLYLLSSKDGATFWNPLLAAQGPREVGKGKASGFLCYSWFSVTPCKVNISPSQ